MITHDLIKLNNTRTFLKDSAEIMRQAKEEFDNKNKKLIDSITKAKEEQADLIKNINIEALLSYSVDCNKDIGCGVKITNKKIFEYDEKKAFEWAKQSGMALTLDVKIFKDIAKVQAKWNAPFEFVTITEKPSVTIPGKIEIGED